MAGLVPAIHVFGALEERTWMSGASNAKTRFCPGMTTNVRLDRLRLDHIESSGRSDRGYPKAGPAQQMAVLRFGALHPAGTAKHIEIAQREGFVLIVAPKHGRHQPLDQQQRSGLRNRAPAILQDRATTLIVPIVNDALENDAVGNGRHGFEKISRSE